MSAKIDKTAPQPDHRSRWATTTRKPGAYVRFGSKAAVSQSRSTLTRDNAARAIDACRRCDVVLALGENDRFSPSMQEIQRIVASGDLDEPMHIEGHTSNENLERSFGPRRHFDAEWPSGGMTRAGIHIPDAFIHLMGPCNR